MSYGRNANTADILIIGAGLSGMTTAIEMIKERSMEEFHHRGEGKPIWRDVERPEVSWMLLRSKDAEFGREYTVTSRFLFEGKKLHSADWDWDYDVRGKRVGIIGNGATAAQIVPEVKVYKDLVVFQRTANQIVPRGDKEISPFMQSVYRWVPSVMRRYRAALMDFREGLLDVVFDKESPSHEAVVAIAKAHMENQLPGDKYKDSREKLLPNHALGCKRVLMTDDYYATFRKENVKLETTPIQEITKTGIRVDGQEHEIDLLVLAIGFQTMQFMYPIKIYDEDGKSIEELWKSGAKAFFGMTVPHLPNFSMLYGTSRLSHSAFADPNCNSWYKDESGLITNNWAGNVIEYQEKTRVIDWEDYEVKDIHGKVVKKTGETKWRRRHEETQTSNGMILGSLTLGVGAIAMSVLGKSKLGLMR
ncbi:hypothetical protein ACMFMG_000579 [Clarireedia jacksonii]